MQAKFYNQTPPTLFVLAAFAFLLLLLGRESYVNEDLPAFLPLNDNFVRIELSGELALPGVYQINDALPLNGAINLTGVKTSQDLLSPSAWNGPFQDGENLEIIENDYENQVFSSRVDARQSSCLNGDPATS